MGGVVAAFAEEAEARGTMLPMLARQNLLVLLFSVRVTAHAPLNSLRAAQTSDRGLTSAAQPFQTYCRFWKPQVGPVCHAVSAQQQRTCVCVSNVNGVNQPVAPSSCSASSAAQARPGRRHA